MTDISEKLGGLQVARAIAALGVAYFHSWHVTLPFPPDTAYPIPLLRDYGALGVELFFALSGFVICLLVTSPRFEPASFAIQRFFRIWPLWVASSMIFLHLTKFLGRSATQTTPAFYYSLTLLPTEGFPFYDIGWSLQHEIAFYLIAAFVVPRLGLYALIGILGLCAVTDYLWTLPWYLHQYFHYYPYFISGIVVFLARPVIARAGTLAPFAAGAAILILTSRSLLPIATLLLVIAFSNLKTDTWLGKTFVALGDASYSIYLLHPLVYYYVYIHLIEPLPPLWVQEPLRYAALIVVCLLSLASWRFFERPMIGVGRHLATALQQIGSSRSPRQQ